MFERFLVIQNLHWYNNAVATVAQLAEQALRKRQVKGSSPFGGFIALIHGGNF